MASAGDVGVIGRGITIRGSLSGQEPLVVEGRIEGNISLRSHLTVEQTGVVVADVEADNLTVQGEVHGNVQAGEAVSVSSSAKVVGNIRAPRVIIEDGARFKGGIEMDFELPDGLGPAARPKR